MTTFWIRYTIATVTTTLRLGAASILERENTERISGVTLRGRRYGHKLHTSKTFEVVIYPHMLNYSISTLQAISRADRIEVNFSTSSSTPVSGWTEVFIDGGEESFERVDNLLDLHVYTFKFFANSIESGA